MEKKRIMNLKKVCIIIIIIAILGVFSYKESINKVTMKETYMQRKIEYLEHNLKEKPQNLTYSTYQPNLPDVVEKDIEELEKNNLYYVLYKGKEIDVRVYKDGSACIVGNGNYHLLNKPSIYKNNGEIVIYGITNRRFVKETTFGYSIDVLDNIDIPESVTYFGNNIYPLKKSTILIEENQISIYQNGIKMAYEKVENVSQIKNWNTYNYLGFETKNGDNYMLFVSEEEGNYWIKAEKILATRGNIINKKIYLSEEERYIYFPISKDKNDNYYTVLPENMSYFEKYNYTYFHTDIKTDYIGGTTKENVILNEICLNNALKNVEFMYTPKESYDINNYSTWYAKFNFSTNPVTSILIEIDGYDIRKSLSRSKVGELEITVNTIEEYWNNVDKIRNAYNDLYTKPIEEITQ